MNIKDKLLIKWMQADRPTQREAVEQLNYLAEKKRLLLSHVESEHGKAKSEFAGGAGQVCLVDGDSPEAIADQIESAANFGPELVFSVGFVFLSSPGNLEYLEGVLGV